MVSQHGDGEGAHFPLAAKKPSTYPVFLYVVYLLTDMILRLNPRSVGYYIAIGSPIS